jgi:flotillin
MSLLILPISLILVLLGTSIFFFSRYKRCPPDKILVIYGKTGGGLSSRCIHGGAVFIMPLFSRLRAARPHPFSH